ncbi:hypothetical protein DXG01_001324 [Tephrocybe rancida]|nr:hypothetical protein DXG01_001324 [Tephrocybe rancida]
MSPYTVNVSGIAPSTTEAQLHDFFTFCGKISEIKHEKDKADIHFEKSSAAKTALMLNGGTLDGNTLSVTSDKTYQDIPEESTSREGEPIEQSDKPRAGSELSVDNAKGLIAYASNFAVAAEYLARGYILGDHILKRAIDIDSTQGISQRFLSYFHQVDKSLGTRALGPDQTISSKVQSTVDIVTERAKAADEQKGYSKTAHDYYARAVASPLGQQVRSFYTSTSKQVQDIHEEAKRIAEQHTAAGAQGEKSDTTGESAPTPVQPKV